MASAQLAALMLLEGCGAGWHQESNGLPTPLPPRQQVQVWQGRQALPWHAVQVTADSVSGIPYVDAVSCDSCRVAVRRSSVDSMRLGDPTAGLWQTIGVIVAVPVVVFFIGCHTSAEGC